MALATRTVKRSFLFVALVGAIATAVAASSHVLAAPLTQAAAYEAVVKRLPPAAPPGQTVLYGHIRSLVRKGGRFEMRFDPAWWLHGVAAERAAVEDGAIAPGEPVPNDYYIVDEGHRLLTFVVASSAPVTILTRGGGGVGSTTITVSELTQLLRGKNPKQRPVYAPLRDFGKAFGFWIRIGDRYPNAVRQLDQQYRP